jgi:hypothetical protein
MSELPLSRVVMFLTRQLLTTDVKVTARLELTSSQAVALFKVSILRMGGWIEEGCA